MSVITLNVKRKPWKYVNFFKKFAFQILQKMGWKWGQLCLGCLEGFCFCFDVWIQCCHNEHSSFILQKSHQEQMHEHFLNLWRRLINLKVAKSENLCILRSTTVIDVFSVGAFQNVINLEHQERSIDGKKKESKLRQVAGSMTCWVDP